VTPVMVTVTGSPSGSVAPDRVTVTNLWFGGQRVLGVATTELHTGGLFVLDGDGDADGDFDGDSDGDGDADGDFDGDADGDADGDGDGDGDFDVDIDGDTEG
jgi:hypothetical protein